MRELNFPAEFIFLIDAMFTTIDHRVRKAFLLSCNDYVILQAIYGLSKNEKYGNWCIATKKQLAEWYDIGEATIYRTVKMLVDKGLVIKDEKTGWLKTTDEWNEIQANVKDWLIAFDGKESQFVSGKQGKFKVYQNDSDTIKMIDSDYQNDRRDTIKMIDNNNKDNNNNNITSSYEEVRESDGRKDETMKHLAVKADKEEYGNPEINKMLEALKQRIGIDDFADSQKWQRIYGKHCFNLMRKIGKDEFVMRLDNLLVDEFRSKRMNEIRYVYEQLKGYKPPAPRIAIIS